MTIAPNAPGVHAKQLIDALSDRDLLLAMEGDYPQSAFGLFQDPTGSAAPTLARTFSTPWDCHTDQASMGRCIKTMLAHTETMVFYHNLVAGLITSDPKLSALTPSNDIIHPTTKRPCNHVRHVLTVRLPATTSSDIWTVEGRRVKASDSPGKSVGMVAMLPEQQLVYHDPFGLPPPDMLRRAIEDACRQHSFSARFVIAGQHHVPGNTGLYTLLNMWVLVGGDTSTPSSHSRWALRRLHAANQVSQATDDIAKCIPRDPGQYDEQGHPHGIMRDECRKVLPGQEELIAYAKACRNQLQAIHRKDFMDECLPPSVRLALANHLDQQHAQPRSSAYII